MNEVSFSKLILVVRLLCQLKRACDYTEASEKMFFPVMPNFMTDLLFYFVSNRLISDSKALQTFFPV